MFSEGMNVYKWVSEFEKYLECAKITNSNKQAQQLMKYLDISSRNLLRRACQLEYDDSSAKIEYSTIKQQLLQLFVTTRINQRDLRIRFYNRVQASDETIHRYNHELSEMAREAYPLLERKSVETFIYQQFLYGVRNPKIRQQLLNDYGMTVDLNEVIRVAKLQEELEDMETKRNAEVKVRKIRLKDNKSSDEEDKEERTKKCRSVSFERDDSSKSYRRHTPNTSNESSSANRRHESRRHQRESERSKESSSRSERSMNLDSSNNSSKHSQNSNSSRDYSSRDNSSKRDSSKDSQRSTSSYPLKEDKYTSTPINQPDQSKQQSRSSSIENNRRNYNITCYNCNKSGHKQNDCWSAPTTPIKQRSRESSGTRSSTAFDSRKDESGNRQDRSGRPQHQENYQ